LVWVFKRLGRNRNQLASSALLLEEGGPVLVRERKDFLLSLLAASEGAKDNALDDHLTDVRRESFSKKGPNLGGMKKCLKAYTRGL